MNLTDEKTAHKTFLAARDISDAGDYLWSLREISKSQGNLPEHRLTKAKEAILIAAVVVYARPFIDSYSNGQAARKISPSDVALFDGRPDLESLHQRALEIRHKAIAHADWNFHPTALVSSEDCLGFSRESPRPNYFQLINPDEFSKLIDHV